MRDLSRAGTSDRTYAVFVAFALVETAGLAGLSQGTTTWPVLLAGHGLCLAAAAAALRTNPGADLTFAVLGLLLCVSTGPVGAGGALALRLIVRRTRIGAQELAAWYHRLAGVAQAEASVGLYERILDGRVRRPTGGVVDHFPTALGGNLPQQQAVLGLIGLDWHPDYKPILAQALCSPEPSIRVHAAAVSVKLRACTLAAMKRAQETMAAGPADPATLAATFLDLADRGFLDDAKARAAQEDAVTLCRRTLSHDPADARAGALLRRALVQIGCPEGTRAALAGPAPAADRRDWAVRLRGLMVLGDVRGLHALLAARGDPAQAASRASPPARLREAHHAR
ncbi:hypothetical protein MKK68_16935 [Methylobacterium sp. E-016]|uniref:hypothetical protein n=1 Tax=Methylobacterium sp. E-016 TaxID=2836556 RepID=UPI001FBA0AAA|nr:hypothetical protein [Methylobacterium sp. E-016]MCJ2077309.1 hypothetical protein [Methylobacterium sp. E-016]